MPKSRKACSDCQLPREPWRHISKNGLCKECAARRAADLVRACWPEEAPNPVMSSLKLSGCQISTPVPGSLGTYTINV